MAPMRGGVICVGILLLVRAEAASDPAPKRPTYDEYKKDKAIESAKADAAAAKQSKMGAVDKVIVMLGDLQKQVMSEGEKEAQTYNKFACFCKDMTAEKTEAIEKGKDEKERLTASIGEKQEKRDALDSAMEAMQKEIEEADKEMKKAVEQRGKELKEYEVNAADLAGAVAALEGAIKSLKASKNPSLAQLRSISKNVRSAALMADALGLGDVETQRSLASLLQGSEPEVPMEDYKFHSDSVIETLEKLLVKFRDEKNAIDAAEVKAVAAHDAFMQEKTDFVKRKNVELEDARKEKGRVMDEIATLSSDLTTTAATLLDDQAYLAGVMEMCTKKAKTWDERSSVRADELSALTAAMAILKETVSEKVSGATIRFAQRGVDVRLAERVAQSEDAMEALEAEAESGEASPSFLQRRQAASTPRRLLGAIQERSGAPDGREAGRLAVVELFRMEGKQLHSKELSTLAARIIGDPFAKVKTLIQELIDRLLAQAAAEATQKGWCDDSLAAAREKRDQAAGTIEEVNSGMAPLEALRNKLTEELAVLKDEIEAIEAAQDKAKKMRAEETAENEKTVSVATEGLDAVGKAIDILTKFYATAKAEKGATKLLQGPADDAPDAGFAEGEAYTGAQGAAGGVLGMLDVIKSDFQRTITETEKAEKTSEQEHVQFMTDSGKTLAEKQTASEEKTTQKDEAEEKITASGEDLQSQTALLQKAIEELLELQPVCIDTGMSYEDRVDRRKEEIASLKRGLCVLQSYAEYGAEVAARC